MATTVMQVMKYTFKRSVKVSSQRICDNFLLPNVMHSFVRYRVTTDTGAFLPQPKKTPFGLVRVLLTVLPGLYLGATVSKEGAAFLEENDIFVPDEDDDED